MIVAWDNLGGVCRVVNRVAEHLRTHGHGVHLLFPGTQTRPQATVSREGFPAYRLRLREQVIPEAPIRSRIAFWLTLPLTLFVVTRLIRRHDVDVINVHYPGSNTPSVVFLRRVLHMKIVTSVHGSDLLPDGERRFPTPAGLVALLRASDAIVVPSGAFAGALRSAWPEIDPSRLHAIPNGIDPAELGYAANSGETATDPPYILSIAHLTKYKGVDVLIRAFAMMAGRAPGLRLRLISDGPAREDLERLAASLGMSELIDFLGLCDRAQVAEQLRGCTLFVLPSRSDSESFGIAAAEAMALDRPVIASRVGGLVDLIEDGVSGVLVQPGDVAALADAMTRLLSDASLRARLGKSGGERVRRDYSWQHTGSSYETLFRRVISGQRS